MRLTRAVWSASTQARLQLYQYAICPYCNKAKAMLDYFKVPFESIEVNPLTKSEVKGIETGYTGGPVPIDAGYKKVPIARFPDGSIVPDSRNIFHKIAADVGVSEAFHSAEAEEWVAWADKKLMVLLYPNMTRSFAECWQALGYLNNVPAFGAFTALSARTLGAFGMSMAHGKILKKYNITDERAALLEQLQVWVDAVGDKEFRGGAAPDASDVAVFGALRGLAGVPLHAEVLAFPGFSPWYARMEGVVKPAA